MKRLELVSDESGVYMAEAADGEYVRYAEVHPLVDGDLATQRAICDGLPGPNDRVLIALESCASKLQELGNTFNSRNFTDRYGDGPICVGLAKLARTICDEVRRDATGDR